MGYVGKIKGCHAIKLSLKYNLSCNNFYFTRSLYYRNSNKISPLKQSTSLSPLLFSPQLWWVVSWVLRSKQKIYSKHQMHFHLLPQGKPLLWTLSFPALQGEVWVSSCPQTMGPEHRIASWIMHHSIGFLPPLSPSPSPKLSSPEISSPINYLYPVLVLASVSRETQMNIQTQDRYTNDKLLFFACFNAFKFSPLPTKVCVIFPFWQLRSSSEMATTFYVEHFRICYFPMGKWLSYWWLL